MLMPPDKTMDGDVIVGAEVSDVSLVDFDRHLIRDFSPGRCCWCCRCCIV